MSELEILDIVDQNGEVIGQAPRFEVHKNPNLIHGVVHCWIFNKRGQVLWQQRSFSKKLSPGKWDVSCGGHILSGDTPDKTLIRELAEELGITYSEPVFVEKYLYRLPDQTELVYLYYAIISEETEFKLQVEEVEKVEWIDIDKAIKMVLDNKRESTEFILTQVPRILQKVFAERYEKI